MGRSPCCEKVGLKKGPWTPEEDQKLLAYIEQHGHGSWRALPAKAGLERCGKSCRLRWTNYLRPDIKRGKFSLQEEQTIIQLHALLGNRWSAIANHLPKRTDNEIKNYWNTHLKKRLTKMGIDPVTHKPKSNPLGSAQSVDTANLNHMAQWESARLEAEARLVKESKLVMSKSTRSYSSASSAQLHSKAAVQIPPRLDILKAWQGAIWSKPNIGSIESPTSCLQFPDNIFNSPSTGFADKGDWKCSERLENEKVEGTTAALLHEIEPFSLDVACVADSLGLPSFLDGFEGLLSDEGNEGFSNITGIYDNLGSSCGGSLEDNKKYWNTTL